MVSPDTQPKGSSVQPSQAKRLARKIVTLVALGLLLGWAYDWAAPRFYNSNQPPGFLLGVLHGALMPTALPSLLLGKDVPIYAPRSTGRPYKLGYICGINLCGLLFFGSAFWRPRNPTQKCG